MKRFFFLLSTFFVFGTSIAQPVSATIDTIFKCPFFYYGDFPHTGIYHDSVYCSASGSECVGEIDSDYFFVMSHPDYHGYMTHFHSDDTLKAIGVAFSHARAYWKINTFIYNEDSKEIAHASGIYFNYFDFDTYTEIPIDTINYFGLEIPGLWDLDPGADSLSSGERLFMTFFDEPVNIIGDFYVGLNGHHKTESDDLQKLTSILHIFEDHEPPYNFPQRAYRILQNDTWVDYISSSRAIPILFPIIEPPCPKVDSVRVSVDSAGYLVAEWDSLPYQEQWVVHYQRPGMTVIDTVNRCLWRRNVFDTTSYTISVRSRCTNLRSLTWSDWCTTVKGDTTAAIPNSHLSPLTFHLYPNPSTGDVTVFIPSPFLTPHSSFLTVFDASGREVIPPTPLTSHLSHLTFHLPDGIYLVRVTTPHGTATQKLTIAR